MKTLAFANSLALASGIIWIICSIFIWVLPDSSLYVAKIGFMGLEGFDFAGFNLDFSTFFAGLVLTLVFGWIFGFLWGAFYQKFSK
ncbi:MAG: DUF5676 family membrane protein [Patescibacteria group bacterium]